MSWLSSLLLLSSESPKYQQIAEGITLAIKAGQLPPGHKLPSSRQLSKQLLVHRNTVLLAFDDLIAQGWLTTISQKGTYVSQSLPRSLKGVSSGRRTSTTGFSLPRSRIPVKNSLPIPHGAFDLSGGLPDLHSVPSSEIARAFRRSITKRAGLEYGDPRGHHSLRQQLAHLLTEERGLATKADEIFVTQGSQGALHLIASTLIEPGDKLVIEQLGYRPAWDSFRLAGATLNAIPVDENGLDTEKLAVFLQSNKIRALYLTPHHQYPTTAVLSASRRIHLLALAKKHRFAIIEDDYDNEVHYIGRPVLPMAASDRAGCVLYVGTLSKVLAPGIRVGYLVAPDKFLERSTKVRECIDRQGCPAIEMAIAELLEDGVLGRHARKMRRIYLSRRNVLVTALGDHFGDSIHYNIPQGGLALWVRSANTDVEAWALAARKENLYFQTARHFSLDNKSRPAFRLCYANSSETQLREAIGILAMSRPL